MVRNGVSCYTVHIKFLIVFSNDSIFQLLSIGMLLLCILNRYLWLNLLLQLINYHHPLENVFKIETSLHQFQFYRMLLFSTGHILNWTVSCVTILAKYFIK